MPDITLEVADGVAVLTIDNPEVRNALTRELSEQLVAVCDEIDGRPEIGATILRGAGGTFCSGHDTRRWNPDILGDESYATTEVTLSAFLRVGRLATPTIAAVQGAAVGAGINLMLATDLRIVADDARLMTGFMRLGIHPGGGCFTLLGRSGGRELAAAMGLFAEEISGREAAERGLAWAAVPAGDVDETALTMARRIAGDPLLARRAAGSFRRELGPPAIPWETAIEAERGVQMWSRHRREQAKAATTDRA